MSTEPSPSSTDYDGAQLRQLISAWCDGAVEEADLRRLEATLAASNAGRQIFIALMHIHAQMHGQSMAQEYQEYSAKIIPFLQNPAELPVFPPVWHPRNVLQTVLQRTGRFYRWGWAALLLIGIVGWSVSQWMRGPTPPTTAKILSVNQDHSQERVSTPDQPREVLAWVTEHSDDCQWLLDKGGQTQCELPRRVRRGDTIRTTQGTMKLTFNNGTIVTLHGPALFQVMSDMRARVLLGTVTAHVAAGAEGFSILAPRATVIDLGTEFGVQVNEVGATDVVVFKGEVNLDYMNQTEEIARQRLRVGEGMHLDARGTPSRIVSITDDWHFEAPASDSLRPPVITAVHDNISRGAWNYYEIVANGMREDAKAFADREAHEWNGVTESGMPPYLLGGDYVKTFNNDKVTHDIEITVTLNRAAKLYILFDKRIPPTEWLKRDFRNTGDEIGVDEGPFLWDGIWYPRHKPGVGPGVNIDHVSSVWVRDVAGPASVKLGPTESKTGDVNMYGIVAVPVNDGTTHWENKEDTHSR